MSLPTLRNLAFCFSLANLCFLTNWVYFVGPGQYFRKGPASRALLASNLINIAILTAVLWAGFSVARRSRNAFLARLAEVVSYALLLVPLNAIRKHFFQHSLKRLDTGGYIDALFFAVVLCGALALARWPGPVVRGSRTFVLWLSPFAVLTLLQHSVLIAKPDIGWTAAASPRLASMLPAVPAHRVLWIVFDEMDEELTFGWRPTGLRLPELDRFRAQALDATGALPAGPDTRVAMPALIAGERVSEVVCPAKGMIITLADSGTITAWAEHPNAFAKVRNRGLNVGVAGWCLPYCREFGTTLSECAWEPAENLQNVTVSQGIPVMLQNTLDQIPGLRHLSVPGASEIEKDQLRAAYIRLSARAMQLAVDRRLALTLLHWPVPHPPGIYDRARARFNSGTTSNYVDNLVLVDRTVGELRRTMERAGVWDSTTILLTADHPWRPGMWSHSHGWTGEESRLAAVPHKFIPFLLRIAGQKEGMTYSQPFDCITTGDLILAILDGKLSDARDVIQWMEHHGAPNGLVG